MELTVPYYMYNIWTINFYKETINHYRYSAYRILVDV